MSGDTTLTSHGHDTAKGMQTSAAAGRELGGHADTSLSPAEAAAAGRSSQEAAVYAPPGVGPRDPATLPGPFTSRQLSRVDEALALATRESGLLFSLYVGPLPEPTRAGAEAMVSRIPAAEGVGVVLVAVSPGQRVLHIVTARGAARQLSNRACALAALGMRAAFAGGDLTAGVVNGLRMLADSAGAD